MRAPGKLVAATLLAVSAALVAQQDYPRSDDQREWNKPAQPFRIAGAIHYVGTFDLATYLITTDAGHILMDSGLETSAAQIQSSVKALGFNLRDIRILLNTQAHFDHAAGLATLKRVTGARLLASAEDAALLEAGGRADFAFGDSLTFPAVEVDGIVRDGEPVTLGAITLTPRITPGHTKGTTTWTTTIADGERRLSVVFAGSTSVNPGVRLVDNPRYPAIADDYRRTFAVLKALTPDIFLTQHASAFALHDKAKRLQAGETPNPFIDPDGYRRWLTGSERAFLERLAAK